MAAAIPGNPRFRRSRWRTAIGCPPRGGVAVVALIALAATAVVASPTVGTARPAREATGTAGSLAPLAACDGTAWLRVNVDVSIEALAGDPAGGFVYAASKGGTSVFRSALSEGDRWTKLDPLDTPVSSIDVAPGGAPLLVGLFGAGVMRSDDRGENFGPDMLPSHYVTAVAASESGAYAAASRPAFRGVYVDRGDGAGYVPLGAFAVDTFLIWRLELGPDGTPWVGTNRRGPYRWDGSVWQAAADPQVANSTVHAIAFDARDHAHMYLGLGDPGDPTAGEVVPKGLRISTDGGASYGPARFNGSTVPAIAPSAVDGRAFASIWGDGLHMTRDHGRTWRRLHQPEGTAPYFQALLAIVPAGRTPLQCELLFAGDSEGLWVRNVGSGRAWLGPIYLPRTLAER